MRTGVLLINLGSPDSTSPADVGRYLRQFLNDKHVITLPAPLRWLLVNGIIVPFRKYKSAAAYQKIWGLDGSPLVSISQRLAQGVGKSLGGNFSVALGMRYGSPSIESAITELKLAGAERIVALPLYPQYAASSTLTAIEATVAAAEQLGYGQKLQILEPFYEHPAFIRCVADRVEETMQAFSAQHLLISFHGLPESAIRSSCEIYKPCLIPNISAPACPSVDFQNRKCYRAQAYATARALAARLGLKPESYTVAFQSRLSSRWIQPFSDEVLEKLAKARVRKLAVVCPSFVADCLETLEEIAMRAAEDFRAAGGGELRLIEAPNADSDWVEAVANLIKEGLAS